MNDREKAQSNNFCIIYGKPTDKKRIIANNVWENQFFVCGTCQKVWCADCMGAIIGLGAKSPYSLGKK